jgi:hypothetical protein
MTQNIDPLPPEPRAVRVMAGGSALLMLAAIAALTGLVLLIMGEALAILLLVVAVGLVLVGQLRLKHAASRRDRTV